MTDSFRNLLFWASLFGLPMAGTCATGCGPKADVTVEQQQADAKARIDTLEAAGKAAARAGLSVRGEMRLMGPAEAGLKQSAFLDPGWRFDLQFENDPEVAAEFQREIMRRELEPEPMTEAQ